MAHHFLQWTILSPLSRATLDSPVISYWLHCGCDKLYKTAAIIYTYYYY